MNWPVSIHAKGFTNLTETIEKPLNDMLRRHPGMTECRPAMEEAFAILRDAFQIGHKVLLCGNGGSAADCEHWSGELLKSFCSRRPLKPEIYEKLSPALRD